MATLTPSQVYALARNAGLSPAASVIATAVATAESGLRTDAMGDVGLQDGTWGPSVGLWQIRSLKAQYGTGQPRDASRLTDPQFNAQSMASISGTGSNWQPWTTYTKGTYRQFLDTDRQAATAAGDNPAAGATGSASAPTTPDSGAIGAAGIFSPIPGVVSWAADAPDWADDVLKIGLYALGGATAAALVVVGAVRTVSGKG